MRVPYSHPTRVGPESSKLSIPSSNDTLAHAWTAGSATCMATVSVLSDATDAEPDLNINLDQAANLLAGCMDTLKYFPNEKRKTLLTKCAVQDQDDVCDQAWSAAANLVRSWRQARIPDSFGYSEQVPLHEGCISTTVCIFSAPLYWAFLCCS
jgi:hypothetical protein